MQHYVYQVYIGQIKNDKNSKFSILKIDLRWNNVGAVGGRALLAACQSNSTLNELHLVGNNVPDDIMQTLSKQFLTASNKNLYFKFR